MAVAVWPVSVRPLAAWDGASEGDSAPHWSLQPVKSVLPPTSADSFVVNPVDSFILAGLEAQALRPSPPADRRTLVRRLYLAMLGLPHAPAEVAAFLEDSRPDAYARLVERVLASPHYGDRWAQHWLDVVRYGDTDGFEVNTPRPNAWPYRDWVIRAFNEDKPFERFVLEQLAGDTVGEDAATGFLVAGPALLPGQTGRDLLSQLQARQDELHEMVSTAATAFLGLTVGCARCHDHKFDPIPQSDYYALQAVFAGVRFGERPLRAPTTGHPEADRLELRNEFAEVERRLTELEPPARVTGAGRPRRPPVHPRRNVERFARMEARFVRFTVTATNDGTEPCLDELEVFSAEPTPRNVARAKAGARVTASSTYRGDPKHQLAHLNDGRYGNGRSWISAEPGAGWVQIELPATTPIDRVVWGRDREGKFGDRLAVGYRVETAVEPGRWRLAASSEDRLPHPSAPTSAEASTSPSAMPPRSDGFGYAPALTAEEQREYEALRQRFADLYERVYLPAGAGMVFAGKFGPAEETHRLHRGDPLLKRERLGPEALSVLRGQVGGLSVDPGAPESERRAALARWIARPDHPLTARVLVNRLWQHHFGVGLVDTPSDLGRNGSQPTHPELLDYLAAHFIESGGSVKALHRLILLSSTYQQADTPNPQAGTIDHASRRLWHFPPRRLEAEAIRDGILAVSGSLDRRMGGPGFLVFKPNSNYVRVYDAKEEWGQADWRRMVYAHKVRMAPDGVFGAFDCPDAGLPAPRRSRSTTAVQALNLFNSTFVLQQAERFARRVEAEVGGGLGDQVTHAFQLALQRSPTDGEREACLKVAAAHGLPAVCRVLFNANEFLFLP
jgi:hypothetical protein